MTPAAIMSLCLLPVVGLFAWAIRCCCIHACGCSAGLADDGYLVTINGSYSDGSPPACTGCSGLDEQEIELAAGEVDLTDPENALWCDYADDFDPDNPTGCVIHGEACPGPLGLDCQFDCADCYGTSYCPGTWTTGTDPTFDDCVSNPCNYCYQPNVGDPDQCPSACSVESYAAGCDECNTTGSLPVVCEYNSVNYTQQHDGMGCNPTPTSDPPWSCECDLSGGLCICVDGSGTPEDASVAFTCGSAPPNCTNPSFPYERNAGVCECTEAPVDYFCDIPACGQPGHTVYGEFWALIYQADDGNTKLVAMYVDFNGNYWTSKTTLGATPFDCHTLSLSAVSLTFLQASWCQGAYALVAEPDPCDVGVQTSQYCGGGPSTFDLVAL